MTRHQRFLIGHNGTRGRSHDETRVVAQGGESTIRLSAGVPIRVATQEPPPEGRYVPYSTKLRLRQTGQHVVLAVFDPVSGRISTAELDTAPPGKEK